MKKPSALKIVIVITWIQVVLSVAIFAATASILVAPAQDGFWLGFQDAAARGYAQDAASFGAYEFGRATSSAMISLVCPIGALFCTRSRRRTGLIAFIAVGIVIAVSQHALPIFAVVALIAACRKSVAQYFDATGKRPSQSPEPSVMSVTPPAAQEPRQR